MHVFFDPTGRRRWFLRGFGAVAAVISGILTIGFVGSLLLVPLLPVLPGLSRHGEKTGAPELPAIRSRQDRLTKYLLRDSRKALWREIAAAKELYRRHAASPAPPQPGIVAAFYAPWQETGLHSLRANASKLTHVIPEWLHVNRTGAGLDLSDWDPVVSPHNLDVVKIAKEHHVQVHPILNNAENGRFDPVRLHLLLESDENQARLINTVRDWLLAQGFTGLNLDFENLSDADYPRMPGFVRRLSAALHRAGMELSVDVESSRTPYEMAVLSRDADFIVLMAYDEHAEEGDPGPIASLNWAQKLLLDTLKTVPASKIVLGLGSYAYDWKEDNPPAEAISYQAALVQARDNRPGEPPQKIVDFDEAALNPTFSYYDDDGHGHEVWMLDAITAYNQWLLAQRSGIQGTALWALGSEDPSVWDFLDKRKLKNLPPASVLEKVSYPYDIEFDGEGEILSVRSRPQDGARKLEVDRETGLIMDEEFQLFPSSFMIKRSGYKEGKIVLTFDDGPDPDYTPEILDKLKGYGIPGAFFVIGSSAERYPGLIQREWREGHEIGSHTFTHPNMGAVGPRRTELELNATQRAIECILGRSTIIFRPPYNADAEPDSAEEVDPIEAAAALGYLTVGERIDPQDWNLYAFRPDGTRVKRTAQDMADQCLVELKQTKGNIVLLHDGGGDRAQTLKLVDILVPELRKAGYQFVSLHELLGEPRDDLMPPFDQSKEALLVGVDKVVFDVLFVSENFLTIAFVLAIALGIGRVAFLLPLALVAHKRSKRAVYDPAYRPAVSALVAAYNEAPVIARTVRSILSSDYPVSEVIVVDDGSKDGTSEEVQREFAGEPRVRLIRQENAGKAAALNRATNEARGEILLCLDADTQVRSDAVGLLVRHFQDGRVAAAAGNVKVGNRVNLLTQWQSIEYITSQNLDRRAYGLMNAITVVPGAIGMWRREAVLALGGYATDSVAEDMDLTWRLRQAGWRMAVEEKAQGMTEAPESLKAFVKQRFRWTYGTLQCLWKHRGALFRYGWFGWAALPSLWLFQVAFQALAPLTDVQVLYSLTVFFRSWLERGVFTHDWQPLPQAAHALYTTLFFYTLFFAVEFVGAVVAFALDHERPTPLVWLFPQRFAYRQMMYAVLFKSLIHALSGARQGWGKLDRKGTVGAPSQPA